MKFNWEKVLVEVGLLPVQERIKPEVSIQCPFHDDRHPSLSLNLNKGLWICHAGCGQGRLEYLLAKFLHISVFKVLSIAVEYSHELLFIDELLPNDNELSDVVISYTKGFVPQWVFDRGFSNETLLTWECGTNNKGSLVIPVHTIRQQTVGWIERQVEGQFPKYLYGPEKQFKKSLVLFGEDRFNTAHQHPFLCITEGSLDAMWLSQQGYSSVALLGVYLSYQQEKKLQEILSYGNFNEVVLCLDNDEAGEDGVRRIYPKLKKYIPVSVCRLPNEYKDVQDIRDKKTLDLALTNRSVFAL